MALFSNYWCDSWNDNNEVTQGNIFYLKPIAIMSSACIPSLVKLALLLRMWHCKTLNGIHWHMACMIIFFIHLWLWLWEAYTCHRDMKINRDVHQMSLNTMIKYLLMFPQHYLMYPYDVIGLKWHQKTFIQRKIHVLTSRNQCALHILVALCKF